VRGVIVLAKIRIHESDFDRTEAYYRNLTPQLQAVPGYRGVQVFRATEDTEAHLVLHHYADHPSAKQGLAVLAQNRLLIQTTHVNLTPADVLVAEMISGYGEPIEQAPTGAYLSEAVRVAGPGYGQELAEELDRILYELTLIPGFRGSAYGVNSSLPDEYVSLVTWQSIEAFDASLPATKMYEVRLYQRVI
jgi:heme-degrading monooxygenase HmoA